MPQNRHYLISKPDTLNKKKHILRTESKDEILTIGITSSETEFQISLLLNSTLSIKLALTNPITHTTEAKTNSFPCFKYSNEEGNEFWLIKNKSNNQYLFKNHIFDYIVILRGTDNQSLATSIIAKVKHNQDIHLIAQIEVKNLSGLANIIK